VRKKKKPPLMEDFPCVAQLRQSGAMVKALKENTGISLLLA